MKHIKDMVAEANEVVDHFPATEALGLHGTVKLAAFINIGLGVAFFSPIDTTRYFFPWRPLVCALRTHQLCAILIGELGATVRAGREVAHLS